VAVAASIAKPQSTAAQLAVMTTAAALLTSCAVMWVGPYDEVTDKAIMDLQTKTEQFFAKAESTGANYESSKTFYQDAKASTRSIRLRAELYGKEKNKGELDDIDRLEENLDNLVKLHQAGPLTGKAGAIARAQLEANFQSLLQIELAKKHSSGVSNKSG
jgi:hypothetical protein